MAAGIGHYSKTGRAGIMAVRIIRWIANDGTIFLERELAERYENEILAADPSVCGNCKGLGHTVVRNGSGGFFVRKCEFCTTVEPN